MDMRLWSLQPGYLDSKGLVALWREGLLARKVLEGNTRGYKNHPQLERFRAQDDPVGSVESYLRHVWEESCKRGYCFDGSRVGKRGSVIKININQGQLDYEFELLKKKLESRDIGSYSRISMIKSPEAHPIFAVIPGPVEKWEKVRPL